MPALITSQSPFGNALRDARKGRGLDQTELGQEVGVSQGTVSRWEKGAQLPEPHHMDVLCRDLGLTWEDYGAEVARRFRHLGWFAEPVTEWSDDQRFRPVGTGVKSPLAAAA